MELIIYTYQNSVTQAKELVSEMLKLADIKDKSPDDIFYYGVFYENDRYLDYNGDLPEDCPTHEDYKTRNQLQSKWLEDIKISILKEEIEKPEWMTECESSSDNYDLYLNLIAKEEKYVEFGNKIKALLCSVSTGYEFE